MSNNTNIEIKAYAQLNEKSETLIHEKLKTYNLDEEMNYAVVVLKLLIGNSEVKNKNELVICVTPKIQYITPFVTKKLAEEYIKELTKEDKMTMLFTVDKGKIIIKNEDIKSTIDLLNSYKGSKNMEYGEMSNISRYNMMAYNWKYILSDKEKEEYAFNLGGMKGYNEVKNLLDNWTFTPEFEKEIINKIK